MDEMVALGPSLAARIVDDRAPAGRLAELVRTAVAEDLPVALVGSGTSEHAAMGVAALFADALPGVRAGSIVSREAFGAALDPWPGLCIAISHEGATASTAAALAAARAAGARTAVVTAGPDGLVASGADEVFVTPVLDRSWCHTVGYLSPLSAGAAVAAALRGRHLAASDVERLLDDTLASSSGPAAVAAAEWQTAAIARVVPVGSGADHAAARELALKLEEGARLAAGARDTETLLHGHLAAVDATTAVVVIVADPRQAELRAHRAAQAARAASIVCGPVAAIVSERMHGQWPAHWTGAGLISLPDSQAVDPLVAALLASAVALQVLALAAIHVRGTNPDLIRRDDARYQHAADVARLPLPGTASGRTGSPSS